MESWVPPLDFTHIPQLVPNIAARSRPQSAHPAIAPVNNCPFSKPESPYHSHIPDVGNNRRTAAIQQAPARRPIDKKRLSDHLIVRHGPDLILARLVLLVQQAVQHIRPPEPGV